MSLFTCPICQQKRFPFKRLCRECQTLFDLVQKNLGTVGLSQLMDILIATGIDKPKIKHFLQANPGGTGSIMDQIIARLTTNLAEAMGVRKNVMTAKDVENIRQNPEYGASTKPIDK